MKSISRLFGAATLLALALCLTAACSEKSDDEPQKPDTPETPTNPDDWQTVPASGGTVSRGDITITFPSGTFTTETKVAVTEVEKGSIRGEDEVSTFYQVTMPTVTNRTTTVSIKSDQKDDDIIMVAHSPAASLTGETTYLDMPLDATYKDGAYTAELPVFDNNAEPDYQGTITFGLAHSASAKKPASAPAKTRSSDNGTFVFNFDWGSRRIAQENVELQEEIESYLYEAVGIINGLGIKVAGDRKVPIIFEKDKNYGGKVLGPDEFGRYEIGQWSRKHGYILINDGFRTQAKPSVFKKDALRRTIIHELFHYFQTDYDPRSDFWKGGYFVGDMNGEFLMVYEAGGVWIEKLMGNDGFSTTFISTEERAYAAVRGLCNVVGTTHQNLGYGQSLFLEYMTKQKGDKAVTTLLETWNKKSGSSALDIYKAWANAIGVDLFATSVGMDNFCKFIEDAATGEVLPDFSCLNILPKITEKYAADVNDHFNKDGTITYKGDVNPYGGRYTMMQMHNYRNENGENSLKGKQLVFTEKNAGVRTMVYSYKERTWHFLGAFGKDDDLTITDEATLQNLRSGTGLGITYVYMITYSYDNAKTYPTEFSVTLGNADELELMPNSLSFDAAGSTKTVTVKSNVDDITVTPSDNSWLTAVYDKSKKTIEVTAKANTGNQRDGIIAVQAKSGEGTMKDTITVTQQAAAKGDFDFSQCKTIRISAMAKVSKSTDGTTSYESFSFWPDGGAIVPWMITTTQNGSGLHLEGTFKNVNVRYDGGTEAAEWSMSMDIDDVASGHITNLTCQRRLDTDGTDEWGNATYLYRHWSIQASNIPLPNSSGSTTAKPSNGASINNLEYSYSDSYGEKFTRTFVNSDDWEVTIQFNKN